MQIEKFDKGNKSSIYKQEPYIKDHRDIYAYFRTRMCGTVTLNFKVRI